MKNSIENYVSIKEASILTGIPKRTINYNCEKGTYIQRKSEGTWIIDKRSLPTPKTKMQ